VRPQSKDAMRHRGPLQYASGTLQSLAITELLGEPVSSNRATERAGGSACASQRPPLAELGWAFLDHGERGTSVLGAAAEELNRKCCAFAAAAAHLVVWSMRPLIGRVCTHVVVEAQPAPQVLPGHPGNVTRISPCRHRSGHPAPAGIRAGPGSSQCPSPAHPSAPRPLTQVLAFPFRLRGNFVALRLPGRF